MYPVQLMGLFRFLGNSLEAEICYKLVEPQLSLEEKAMILDYLRLEVPVELLSKVKQAGVMRLVRARRSALDKLSNCC